MKTKIYIRIAQNKKGNFVAAAGSRPSYYPLTGLARYGKVLVLPTLSFAIEFEFPDSMLRQAEQVAAKINLERKNVSVIGKVLMATGQTPSVTKGNEKV